MTSGSNTELGLTFGSGYVALGFSVGAANVTRNALFVSSTGVVWKRAPWPLASIDMIMRDAVVWRSRLVVVGECGSEFEGVSSQALMWVAALVR